MDGAGVLTMLITSFKSDVDVACNVARIVSVLSADEVSFVQKQPLGHIVPNIKPIPKKLNVILTYCLP